MKTEWDRRMWFAACAILSCISIVACSSPKQEGPAVFANPGFESGNLEPWLPFQSVQASAASDHIHAGKFSLAEAGAPGSVYQDVRVKPGGEYTVSAWISGSPGATATGQIAFFDADKNVATYSPAVKPSEAWQQLKYSFTAPSTAPARIHLFRTAGDGTIYWDDVEIAETK